MNKIISLNFWQGLRKYLPLKNSKPVTGKENNGDVAPTVRGKLLSYRKGKNDMMY